ncbi:hypothetical protein LAZ67_16001470 [Cordylochernes scorpioides]|uniref:Uncharacterized protein n=1 Tax=Cordylochernes scorpioides TaxID=51811 RepID=A0ABY6LDF4_9ARAC|nr:hypothetical protein LAZ67_16001470 [Cordylochernes scorpioides]
MGASSLTKLHGRDFWNCGCLENVETSKKSAGVHLSMADLAGHILSHLPILCWRYSAIIESATDHWSHRQGGILGQKPDAEDKRGDRACRAPIHISVESDTAALCHHQSAYKGGDRACRAPIHISVESNTAALCHHQSACGGVAIKCRRVNGRCEKVLLSSDKEIIDILAEDDEADLEKEMDDCAHYQEIIIEAIVAYEDAQKQVAREVVVQDSLPDTTEKIRLPTIELPKFSSLKEWSDEENSMLVMSMKNEIEGVEKEDSETAVDSYVGVKEAKPKGDGVKDSETAIKGYESVNNSEEKTKTNKVEDSEVADQVRYFETIEAKAKDEKLADSETKVIKKSELRVWTRQLEVPLSLFGSFNFDCY